MLKRVRQIIAVISIIMVTFLFVDFTGIAARYLGWIAKVQFLPALLALNVGVIIFLLALTLVFGRVYCSVICPLGILQDGFGWIGKKAKKNRYTYSKEKRILRYVMLALTVIAFIAGIASFVALLAPYSAYGRIASSLFAPIWDGCNNLLADWAEKHESYAFYTVDTYIKGGITLGVAIVTFVVLFILAWRNGRTYCNTICPVGTILSFFARYSIFRPVIDTKKCIDCKLCERNCKASCISIANGHQIDYSRCVTCFDCIEKCPKGAMTYTYRRPEKKVASSVEGDQVQISDADTKAEINASSKTDVSRRGFLASGVAMATVAMIEAKEKTTDGGLAVIEEKKIPNRKTPIVPPGAQGIRHLTRHCTACQLCISECPNDVLRPSTDVSMLMQPVSSYERGYCRPECTRCSNVCPTGAIIPLSRADKSSVQIGHAVWVKENCIPLTDGVECGNCARHCPTGAIMMVNSDPNNPESKKIPVVNTERCIGCGACENLCPARPFSAIYVEGHENHRII